MSWLFLDVKARALRELRKYRWELCVFLLAFAVFSIIAGWSAKTSWVFGDEPENIMVAQSLVKYRTIDLTRVYENRDFYDYHAAELPFPMEKNSRLGILTTHSYVIPLLITPAVALAQWVAPTKTAFLVFLELAFLSSLAMVVLFRFFRVITRNEGASLLTSVFLILSLPMALYSHLVYPDMFEGILFVLAIWTLYSRKLSMRGIFGLVAIMFLLTWLHPKTITFSGMLALAVVFELWRAHGGSLANLWRDKRLYAISVGYVSALLSFLTFNWYAFGDFAFNAQIGGKKTLFTANPIIGILGNLFDQGHGIVLTFPLFALSLPGLVFLYKKDKRLFWLIALTVGVFFFLNMTFWDWYGGFSPAPRYMMPLLPFVGLGIAAVLAKIRTLLNWGIVAVLFVFGFMQVLLLPYAPSSYMYVLDGEHDLFRNLGKPFDLIVRYWPRFFSPTVNDYIGALIISAGIAAITLLVLLDERLVRSSPRGDTD